MYKRALNYAWEKKNKQHTFDSAYSDSENNSIWNCFIFFGFVLLMQERKILFSLLIISMHIFCILSCNPHLLNLNILLHIEK